jgi:hypothetical protein
MGSYLYSAAARGKTQYVFRVCTAGTTICSADRTFKF